MPESSNTTLARLQEDFDAALVNGIELLQADGLVADTSINPKQWSMQGIDRTSVNYTGEIRGDTSGRFPEEAEGSLTASVTPQGLQWQWQAANRAFDWMENNRSVSEDWSFVAREDYVVTLENKVTGTLRYESISIEITGNSDETFDVLVLGSDSATNGVQRVADNLIATRLVNTAAVVDMDDIGLIDTRFVDAILVYTNSPPSNATQVGDFLKSYVDTTNGGVVIGNFAFNQAFALRGGIMDDGYAAFSVGPGTGSGTPVGSKILATADDPIFAGIDLAQAAGNFLRNTNLTNPTVDADATLLAVDENGIPLIARSESGRVISTNFFPRDLDSSNLGPNGESLLTAGEQEFYELLVNALHDASANPLFNPPSAEDLTARAGIETVGGTAFGIYEAENALYSDGLLVRSSSTASGDEFLDFQASNDPLEVSWTVDVAAAGYYAVDFVYALSNAKNARPMTVLIDGEIAEILPFLAQSDRKESVWSPQSTLLDLAEGRHTITLQTAAGKGIDNGANLDYMRISDGPVAPNFLTTPSSGSETAGGTRYIKYEAEAAILSDEFLLAKGRGASGGLFVDFPTTDKPLTIAWTVDAAADGVYGLEFLYALSSAKQDRPLLLTIDGVVVDNLDFAGLSNASESMWSPERFEMELDAGRHVIELTSAGGAGINNGANIDYLRITETPLATSWAEADILLL